MMSSLNQHTDGNQAENIGDDQLLLDLKVELSGLTAKYPSAGFSFGGGAAQAQEQIPIICQNIDDAVKALNTGQDPHGNPITKAQITNGLKHLVEATRIPAFVGLVTVVLNSDGIQRLEDLMNKLEQVADRISRPDRIAIPEVQSSQMSLILEWCKRNQKKVVNANVISVIGEARETTFNAAKGTIRSIQENPNQKGVFRLEFDSQEQREPYDFLMLGFEVSGVDDQGNRLVIQKGRNQRIELEVEERTAPEEATPEIREGVQDVPKIYTFWRGENEVGRVELTSGFVFTSDGTQRAQIYSDGSDSKKLGIGSKDGGILRHDQQIYLKKVGRIDENGEIWSLGTDKVVGRVEPTSIPADAMEVVSGAALVLFIDSLHLLEKTD